ncbi:MAG: hypothetical protein RQ760_01375 [Sedimentisphaerales bacterium]|nr:hypothetical protein [Sedimentisphaerales bacterium]
MDKYDLIKLDYEKTVEYIKLLTDIRFKLLALVPIATGAALGFAKPENDPMTGLVLGLLGFLVTLGIIFYDQRNTEIYEKAMQRARLLELHLQIPPASKYELAGGLVGGRPKGRSRKLFGVIEMWHDRGLAFIYSSVLAVWSYLFFASIVTLVSWKQEVVHMVFQFGVPILILVISWLQLHKIDTSSEEVKKLKEEIKNFDYGKHTEIEKNA